jgi:hypothetical protein
MIGCDSYDNRILRLATLSPRAALAELSGAVRAPFTPNVTATFSSTDQGFAEGGMDVSVLGSDTFVEDVIFDIQVSSAFTGTVFQSLYDFFYNKTSGFQATLEITGSPRYTPNPFPTPLSNFANFIPHYWPDGWLLTKYNGIKMRFTPQVTPIPNVPVTITATFRCYQYICYDLDTMSEDAIIARLAAAGYDIGKFRALRQPY